MLKPEFVAMNDEIENDPGCTLFWTMDIYLDRSKELRFETIQKTYKVVDKNVFNREVETQRQIYKKSFQETSSIFLEPIQQIDEKTRCLLVLIFYHLLYFPLSIFSFMFFAPKHKSQKNSQPAKHKRPKTQDNSYSSTNRTTFSYTDVA